MFAFSYSLIKFELCSINIVMLTGLKLVLEYKRAKTTVVLSVSVIRDHVCFVNPLACLFILNRNHCLGMELLNNLVLNLHSSTLDRL